MAKKLIRMGETAIDEVINVSNGKLSKEAVSNIIIDIGKNLFKSSYAKKPGQDHSGDFSTNDFQIVD